MIRTFLYNVVHYTRNYIVVQINVIRKEGGKNEIPYNSKADRGRHHRRSHAGRNARRMLRQFDEAIVRIVDSRNQHRQRQARRNRMIPPSSKPTENTIFSAHIALGSKATI